MKNLVNFFKFIYPLTGGNGRYIILATCSCNFHFKLKSQLFVVKQLNDIIFNFEFDCELAIKLKNQQHEPIRRVHQVVEHHTDYWADYRIDQWSLRKRLQLWGDHQLDFPKQWKRHRQHECSFSQGRSCLFRELQLYDLAFVIFKQHIEVRSWNLHFMTA